MAFALASLLLLPAASARADQAAGASAHTLILDPLDVEAPAAAFGENLGCFNALVGYQHRVITSIFGDLYFNCVHQMTLYFNVWATTTIAPLSAAAETTAALSGGGLGSGSHVFSVTVNEGHKIVESDFSNNTFGRDNLVCL
jgi:hypothetical protein